MPEQPQIIYVERKPSGCGIVATIVMVLFFLFLSFVVVGILNTPTGNLAIDNKEVISGPGADELSLLLRGFLVMGDQSKRAGFLYGLKHIATKYPGTSAAKAADDLLNQLGLRPEENGYLECRQTLRRIK